MATRASVEGKAAEYKRLYLWVQALPLEERWRYGGNLKAAKAAFYVEIEEFRCFRK